MRRGSDYKAMTWEWAGRIRRILTPVHISEAYDPSLSEADRPQIVLATALWDTGATGSVVSSTLAKKLALFPTGSAQVNTAAGVTTTDTYVISLRLPNGVGISGVQVTSCPPQPGFDFIIGMDVIALGDFTITNENGRTTMSYRFPSIKKIDYVKEQRRELSQFVGRNDPCPCGSGKKFKKCCGAS